MEEVSLVLSKAQILRLHLLVEYEISRNEVLMNSMCSPALVNRCRFEIECYKSLLKSLED